MKQAKQVADGELWPLPPDYESLTAEGKRQARVNACRLWLLPGTPDELARNRVGSTWFFDTWYLQPDLAADFDPGFYDQSPLPTPPMHWDLSRLWATNRYSVAMLPRGGAKSTHCRRDMIMCMVSDPMHSFVYATSTHDNAKHTGQIVKDQSYHNERIQDDWAPEYGSFLKPSRGDRATGTEYFYLTNNSWLRCVSVESRLRGLRPRDFRIDDPEYDQKNSTDLGKLRAYADRLIFKIVIPMTLRRGSGASWVGTFVTKRHFLWHAMQTLETPEGPRSVDPRFDHWARMLVRAAYEDPSSGKIVSCWPENWPATEQEKKEKNLQGSISLEMMPSLMGVAAFNNEMLGNPGEADDSFFKLDPSANGKHAWWIENVDDAYGLDPLQSRAHICWRDREGATKREMVGNFLRSTRLFMTVDTAFTEHASSDRRCCTLMGVTPENELFVLDMWSDRKPDNILLTKAFNICQKWRCPVIFVEVVKDSFALWKRFQSVVQTRMTTDLGLGSTPAIRDLRPGTMPKVAKIATLDTRFEHHLIKLPIWRRNMEPWWSRLIDQIEGFNPEADESGGLEKDDEIDTLSMSLLALRGRAHRGLLQEPEKLELDVVKEITEGRPMWNGMPLGMALDPTKLTVEDLSKLLSAATVLNGGPNGRRTSRV